MRTKRGSCSPRGTTSSTIGCARYTGYDASASLGRADRDFPPGSRVLDVVRASGAGRIVFLSVTAEEKGLLFGTSTFAELE